MPVPFALIGSLFGGFGSLLNLGATARQNQLAKMQEELNKAALEENTMNSYQAQFIQNWSSWRDAIDNGDNISDAIDSNKLSLLQQEQSINAFNQYLTRWQDTFSQNQQTLKQQGKATYYQLLEQRAQQTLTRLALGHTGGSSSLIEKMARDQVADYAGEDLKLDINGGTYGQTLKDFFLDSLADLTETKGQKEIEQQGWDKTYDALQDEYKNLDEAMAMRDKASENMLKAYEKMINYYDVDSAKSSYLEKLKAYQQYVANANDAGTLSDMWDDLEKAYNNYQNLSNKRQDALAGFTGEDLEFLNKQGSEYGISFKGWENTFSQDTEGWADLKKSFKNLYSKLYVPEEKDNESNDPLDGLQSWSQWYRDKKYMEVEKAKDEYWKKKGY